MTKRTATVTWISYRNFGTYLQAYALQRTLNKFGVRNFILSDKRYVSITGFRGLLWRFKNFVADRRDVNAVLYKRFEEKFLKIDFCWSASDLDKCYDIFICGSDQIWSPYLPFNPYYYLGFTTKKKIAYAPSTGTGYSNDEYVNNVRSYINSFSHIAVREEDGAEMLSRFIDKDIKVVLDPTLLLDNNEWDNVENQSVVNLEGDYIICYFLTSNRWYINYAMEYAKQHRLRVKIFNTNPIYVDYGFELVDAGPCEFISYIKHASKVFTDSYHASIFSILYKKDFVTFKRFRDGGEKDQNARIANLFSKLGISDYFIGEDSVDRVKLLSSPDYNEVESRLTVFRGDSIQFLQDAIIS